MAYTKFKKNYTKSKYRSRRGGCKQTVYGSASYLAKQAMMGVKQLRGIINSELKKYDNGVAGNITTTATVTSVSNIAQGDAITNRNGNSILAKAVNFQGHITWNTASTDGALTMWVICDLQQASDVLPTFADIFNGQGVNSILNSAHVGRYKILAKKHFAQDTSTRYKFIDFNLTLGNHHIRYNGTTQGDIQKAGIYTILVSNQATNTPAVTLLSRLAFYDN